jgi:hypothetical protein
MISQRCAQRRQELQQPSCKKGQRRSRIGQVGTPARASVRDDPVAGGDVVAGDETMGRQTSAVAGWSTIVGVVHPPCQRHDRHGRHSLIAARKAAYTTRAYRFIRTGRSDRTSFSSRRARQGQRPRKASLITPEGRRPMRGMGLLF